MASYPIEIRRCRHIRTNGTQCGSPALKDKEKCFYHEQNRPREVELYMDGERYCDGSIIMPVFEDAHSIQMVIRQVVQLMLTRRIERKDAGLLLYALQIASGNLKAMQAERAKPTQVVVDPEKAAETPLGMTPWSATGQGHDQEEEDTSTGEEGGPPEAGADNDDFAVQGPDSRKWVADLARQVESSLDAGPDVEARILREALWEVRDRLKAHMPAE